MSRVYYIHDQKGDRQVSEASLPLSIGGRECCDVVLTNLSADKVAAHIAISEGHAYIQPADDSLALFHNHEYLSDSRWLKSGDRIQIGEDTLTWTVQGDQVYIDALPTPGRPPEPAPPDPPPPLAPPGPELPATRASEAPPREHRKLLVLIATLLTLLLLAAVFVLVATPVALRISPEPDTRSLNGLLPVIPFGERLLALPGEYVLHATHRGYRTLEKTVEISRGGFSELQFEMEELPGRVKVHVNPAVPFRLKVNDTETAVDADGIAEIERGIHTLLIETDRYLPELHELGVMGFGKLQDVNLRLRPAWAEVRISTEPAGAGVQIDGEHAGTTPLVTEMIQGEHTIVLEREGHKPVRLKQAVTAGENLRLEDIVLPPADGRLALSSVPDGATVSLNGNFRGTTPLMLELSSGTTHRLQLSLPGYEKTSHELSLAADEERELSLKLTPGYGVIYITTRPGDAELVVDGNPVGNATRRLRLTTRPHTLEVRKAGYVPHRVTITPRKGISQNLDITLKSVSRARSDATRHKITTADGQVMQLVRPQSSFRMGASRREAGRRANESRRLVQLTRPFYLGVKEVTNASYRQFQPSHDSGVAEGESLDVDNHPVVNVSWDNAARYCNWLSRKDGLPPAYLERDGRMIPVSPPTTGYRLPFEAEWAYVSRVLGNGTPARYPWSGNYPPASPAGNFADRRISDTLADVVPGYDDGYRVTAPAGSFTARPAGFHDLGGNVAEWTGDYYAIYPGEAEQLVLDPTGPSSGDHHVVRGSSWRHGSITELRLSYRDYSRSPRDDLGFRIARYAE